MAQEGKLPEVLPSQDPKRKEVLIITGYDVGTQQIRLALFEMVRDEDGVLRQLRDFRDTEGKDEQVESPLLEAFVDGFTSEQAS